MNCGEADRSTGPERPARTPLTTASLSQFASPHEARGADEPGEALCEQGGQHAAPGRSWLSSACGGAVDLPRRLGSRRRATTGIGQADLARMLASAEAAMTTMRAIHGVHPTSPSSVPADAWLLHSLLSCSEHSGAVGLLAKQTVRRPPATMSLSLSSQAQVRHWRTCAGRLPVPTGPNRQSSGVGSLARHHRANPPRWMLHSIWSGRPRTEWLPATMKNGAGSRLTSRPRKPGAMPGSGGQGRGERRR